jgi:hypothetical protein
MQPYNNDIPLSEPEEFKDFDECAKRARALLSNGFADEVRIMNAKKAEERKKQYREWRKALKKRVSFNN